MLASMPAATTQLDNASTVETKDPLAALRLPCAAAPLRSAMFLITGDNLVRAASVALKPLPAASKSVTQDPLC